MTKDKPPVVSGKDTENNLGMLCHLLALLGLIIPFANIGGPLVLWLVKKDESEVVNYNGKESLNFQISITIYFVVSCFLVLIVVGLLLMFLIAIFTLVCTILAAIKTSKGERYRYPLTIRFIS